MIPDKYKPQPKDYVYPPPTAYQPTPAPSTLTVQQFQSQYGVTPDIPSDAVITGVRRTAEGYEISYYVMGKRRRVEPRKRFIGETPPRQVGWKLGLLEGTLLTAKGYAYEPRKGVYALYETRFIEPKLEAPKYPVGMPPATVLPGKLWRMEKGLLERGGWVQDPETKEFFKYEMVEAPSWKETTIAGQIETKGLMGFFAGLLAPLLPEEKRAGYLETMGLFPEPRGVPIAPRSLAGFIAGPEKYVRMLRGEPTPPMPVSAGLGALLGSPGELAEFEKVSPEYQMGAWMWELGEAWAIGKGTQYVWKGVKKIPGVGKLSSKISTTWERHVTEPFMKCMPKFIQKRYYGPEYTARIAERGLVWEKKPFVGYAEFYAQIEREVATRPPAWSYSVFKGGKTTTPMAYTLERAITKGKPLGGLAATQQIVVTETAKRTFLQPSRLFTEGLQIGTRRGWGISPLLFSAGVSSLLKLKTTARVKDIQTGKIAFRLRQPQLTRLEQVLESKQIVRTKQIQVLNVQQISKQVQKQMQTTMQITLRPPRITKQTFKLRPFRLPKFPKRKRRRVKGFGEEWFFKLHPLATPKEMAAQLFGSPRRKRRRKR